MGKKKHIVIVGAGEAGYLLRDDIVQNHTYITVVGFVDDDGGEVLGGVSDLSRLVNEHSIEEIVIAIPSADGAFVRKVLLSNIDNRIPIRIVSRDQRVLQTNNVRYDAVRDIECEEFLGRAIVKDDLSSLEQFYVGKKVLVTGGAGSIGSEIVRQLIDLGARKVVVYDNSEYLCYELQQQLEERDVASDAYHIVMGSIVNMEKVQAVMHAEKPDIVFHAAAYKHVHLMEENPDEAFVTNVLGTKHVVDAAISSGVPSFVFVSTDKVVRPTSVMGATKKLAEYYVRSLDTDMACNIVRFGNVINSYGSVLPLFERQIRERHEITLTHPDMERYFMSIREAAHLVLTSAMQPTRGSIYILDMGDLIRMQDVAMSLIRSKGLIPNEDVVIKEIGVRPGEKMAEELFAHDEGDRVSKTTLSHIWHLETQMREDLDISEVIFDMTQGVREIQDASWFARRLSKLFPTLAYDKVRV